MKLYKMYLIVLLTLLTFVWYNGCSNERTYEFRQSIDQVVSIEILQTNGRDDYDVLKVIEESDYIQFTDDILKMQGGSCYPPTEGPGYYCVRVTYRDQWTEIFGNGEIERRSPNGFSLYGNFTFKNREEYMAFINKWVDAEEPLTEPT